MKTSQKLSLGLSALLMAYGFFIAMQADRFEKRLHRLERSYQELQARHRTLVAKMLHANESYEAATLARIGALRESLGLPAATSVEVSPVGSEINSMPRVLIK